MIVAPSILAADFLNLENEIKKIEKTKAEWLHLDVMDGNFVPNITFGPSLVKSINNVTNMFLDVHLMIINPLIYIEEFLNSGADLITVHYETCEDFELKEIIKIIKKNNKLVGLSIKPETDVLAIEPYLKDLDLVLIMSVEPGFGGQSFMFDVLEKIDYLKQLKNEFDFLIEVDGGISLETIEYVKDVDVVVAGSYIFNGDYAKNIESLL